MSLGFPGQGQQTTPKVPECAPPLQNAVRAPPHDDLLHSTLDTTGLQNSYGLLDQAQFYFQESKSKGTTTNGDTFKISAHLIQKL